MPELPEVETVRRGLAHLVRGYRINEVQELHPRVRKASSLSPISAVAGARITGVNRRGKFLWFELDRPEVLVAHLGMSGQFLIQQRDRPMARHVRALFKISKGLQRQQLVFNDQRTFGWLSVEELADGVPTSATHIARDPFDPGFDKSMVVRNYAKRNVKIKTALLSQEIMSGVGNIYADEALWRAKVHPQARTSEMSLKKIALVIDSAIEVMEEAILQGGTSFDDLYINVNGESGYFEQSLAAYGQTDRPCVRCGTPIKRIIVGQRSSHFCPHCQRQRR
ncbi:MAG TPA: bifunctional DNA-formamidopyrimidine glycosylase/DNA-(apurinic or apyrimidinic site) lyase [Candidatus Paceibacterota bacterium]|nr:bifunctional DNA-formamidopyrimidine glycosylase/DNA-(apurinic or apyrimidinic site) lyase [Candidatus Paceibacterota bacterium]